MRMRDIFWKAIWSLLSPHELKRRLCSLSLPPDSIRPLDFSCTATNVRQWYNIMNPYQITWQNGYDSCNDSTFDSIAAHALPIQIQALHLRPFFHSSSSIPLRKNKPTDTFSILRPSNSRFSSPPPPLSPALTLTSPPKGSPRPLLLSSLPIPLHISIPRAPDARRCRMSTKTGA